MVGLPLRLVIFVIVTLAIGLAIGALNIPGQCYANLAKPSFDRQTAS
jgi:hypothetical protein